MTLHDEHVRQIEEITDGLAALSRKVQLLSDMQGLNGDQNAAVAMLQVGLDGIRGWDLGICRQTFGLDLDVVDMTKEINGGKS